MTIKTICGYSLGDVRHSLRDAIERKDRRVAARWSAELIVTPGAVGSLWASFWIGWAGAQGAGSSSPTLPILLRQTWETIESLAKGFRGDWVAFRNDSTVRASSMEMLERLLIQPHQTPVVWPSKEIVLFDVDSLRTQRGTSRVSETPIVLRVWKRGTDSEDLRFLAGHWVEAIEKGDMRTALSAVSWSFLTHIHQGLKEQTQCFARGPAEFTLKQRSSPLWFWLELGKSLILSRPMLHSGWITMHNSVVEAFRIHYKRWTPMERMKILLAWVLQLRSSYLLQSDSMWRAPTIHVQSAETDIPYQEIAAELAGHSSTAPHSLIHTQTPTIFPTRTGASAKTQPTPLSRSEEKMKEADAKILAMMGITDSS